MKANQDIKNEDNAKLLHFQIVQIKLEKLLELISNKLNTLLISQHQYYGYC